MEESLEDNNKKALAIYQLSSTIDYTDTILRAWQMELLHYLDETDDRKIIWIYGHQGNEGKSFFQKYIFSFYR